MPVSTTRTNRDVLALSEQDYSAESDSFEKADFLRKAFAQYSTGVTVITSRDAKGERFGVTSNSFVSVSINPPLLLWCLQTSSQHHVKFCASDKFAINVLSEDQKENSIVFAGSVIEDKFKNGNWIEGKFGLPLLSDCVVRFECQKEREIPAGDHTVFLGKILRVSLSSKRPLIFHDSCYHEFRSSLADDEPS